VTMSYAFQGLDPQQARDAAREMLDGAGGINDLIRGINTMLHGAIWEGSDAAAFRNEWQGTFMPNLGRIVELLTSRATELNARADMQESASR
jgi:uncharacterized protein YukE